VISIAADVAVKIMVSTSMSMVVATKVGGELRFGVTSEQYERGEGSE
jgi:hypothetical protein